MFHTAADTIPPIRGAYVLAVRLSEAVVVSKTDTLPAGDYLYCGSARGPGGLRARLNRHMRRGKSLRWHIDRLTEAGTVLGAWAFPDGNECALVAALSALPVPIPGFGSTDCPTCSSHLLAWPPDTKLPSGFETESVSSLPQCLHIM